MVAKLRYHSSAMSHSLATILRVKSDFDKATSLADGEQRQYSTRYARNKEYSISRYSLRGPALVYEICTNSRLNYTIQPDAEWRLKGSILLAPIYKIQVITLDRN